MSKTVAKTLAGFARTATAWMRPYRRAITLSLVSEGLTQASRVETPHGPLVFSAPSARALHDPEAFGRDEPETVRWIEGMSAREVLWDIGANIGLYALYAAKRHTMKVLAFEPGAASYAALVRNVELNKLDSCVESYCIAFDEKTHLEHLNMMNTGAGHSMHAFGQTETVRGDIDPVFRQSVPGFSVDDFCRIFSPPPPDHIKLDVDSIEEKILHGARVTLRGSVKSVLVEIDGETKEAGGGAIRSILAEAGFIEDADFAAPARRNALFIRR
ncbi:MAG: FkbM family methyltransferase [Rhodospirillales bacterium]